MGLAAVGGLGIVILAILLDRITQFSGQMQAIQNYAWAPHRTVSLVLKALIMMAIRTTTEENTNE